MIRSHETRRHRHLYTTDVSITYLLNIILHHRRLDNLFTKHNVNETEQIHSTFCLLKNHKVAAMTNLKQQDIIYTKNWMSILKLFTQLIL